MPDTSSDKAVNTATLVDLSSSPYFEWGVSLWGTMFWGLGQFLGSNPIKDISVSKATVKDVQL